MDADREPNLIPRHGDVCRLPELGDVFGAEDHECTRETGFLGPADDFTEIARELLPGQMAVRVDHDNSQFPTSISQPLPTPKSQSAPSSERWEMDVGSGWALGIDESHRTRAPAGRLGSTATRDGGPVSVLAASTIPCDSIPIIGRGFRLATTTIVRPTS